jgi:hypothetical protein
MAGFCRATSGYISLAVRGPLTGGRRRRRPRTLAQKLWFTAAALAGFLAALYAGTRL